MLPIRYDGAYRRAVSEAFRVVQFNVLAGSLCAPDHFPNVQPRHLDWIARRQRILGALERMEPDIVCLEELDDYWTFFHDEMARQGFGSVYAKRPSRFATASKWAPGYRHDGCGVFFRSSRFSLVDTRTCFFDDNKERVAQLLLLRDGAPDSGRVVPAHVRAATPRPVSPPGPAAARHLLVVCTHLHWDATEPWQERQLQELSEQVTAWTDEMATAHALGDTATLFCGDVNNTPTSALYRHLHASFAAAACTAPRMRSSYALSAAAARGEAVTPSHAAVAGSPDASAALEPRFTSVSIRRVRTIDYIFYDARRLRVEGLLPLPALETVMKDAGPPGWFAALPSRAQATARSTYGTLHGVDAAEVAALDDGAIETGLRGFPNSEVPSDHTILGADLAWVGGGGEGSEGGAGDCNAGGEPAAFAKSGAEASE